MSRGEASIRQPARSPEQACSTHLREPHQDRRIVLVVLRDIEGVRITLRSADRGRRTSTPAIRRLLMTREELLAHVEADRAKGGSLGHPG